LAIKDISQKEVNNNTVELMERIISDIKNDNVNVEQSYYEYSTDEENSVLEVILDKSIRYGQIGEENE
jgi:hypothetical protein